MQKVMLSISEASSTFGLSKKALRNLCHENKIAYYTCGRKIYVNAKVLEEQLSQCGNFATNNNFNNVQEVNSDAVL